MNTKEAIEIIQNMLESVFFLANTKQALDMAIQALEAKEKHEQELNEKMKGIANEMGIPIENTKLA